VILSYVCGELTKYVSLPEASPQQDARRAMSLIICPECHKEISSAAASCPGCGHPMMASVPLVLSAPQPKWSGGIAAVLSLIIPGAGQMYKGQVANGLVWLIFVIAGYFMLIIPGLILHLFCIIGAASGDPTK
jgi:hypothetical protein